jgi:hypothetical protein
VPVSSVVVSTEESEPTPRFSTWRARVAHTGSRVIPPMTSVSDGGQAVTKSQMETGMNSMRRRRKKRFGESDVENHAAAPTSS